MAKRPAFCPTEYQVRVAVDVVRSGGALDEAAAKLNLSVDNVRKALGQAGRFPTERPKRVVVRGRKTAGEE